MYRSTALVAIAMASTLLATESIVAREVNVTDERPNIVFILTDDQSLTGEWSREHLPLTWELLVDAGTEFTNFFTGYSFCCPSRASFLLGQYAHNHRIVGNDFPTGYDTFVALGHENRTVGVELQAAGYTTALVGKYFNDAGIDAVPSGWSEWYGGLGAMFYDYPLNENGTVVWHGNDPADYSTDVLTRHAVDFIDRQDGPFFLMVAYNAPHAPATPAARHADSCAEIRYPRVPSWNEQDRGDKPRHVQAYPNLNTKDRPDSPETWAEAADRHYGERLCSMKAVDEGVRDIVRALEAKGALDNTYIVYTSDNGFTQGEHARFFGKTSAEDQDVRVPFVIRGPGITRGTTIDAMIANHDLAPTFAEIAGATIPLFVDGRSILPLIENADRPWRTTVFLTRYQDDSPDTDNIGSRFGDGKRFNGLRTSHNELYVEYTTGEREYYDLTRDPSALRNAYERLRELDETYAQALSERVALLEACAGRSCRAIEDMPLPDRDHFETDLAERQ